MADTDDKDIQSEELVAVAFAIQSVAAVYAADNDDSASAWLYETYYDVSQDGIRLHSGIALTFVCVALRVMLSIEPYIVRQLLIKIASHYTSNDPQDAHSLAAIGYLEDALDHPTDFGPRWGLAVEQGALNTGVLSVMLIILGQAIRVLRAVTLPECSTIIQAMALSAAREMA